MPQFLCYIILTPPTQFIIRLFGVSNYHVNNCVPAVGYIKYHLIISLSLNIIDIIKIVLNYWNSLPSDVVFVTSVAVFKKCL